MIVDAKPYVVNKMLTIDSNRVEDSKVGCTYKDAVVLWLQEWRIILFTQFKVTGIHHLRKQILNES